MNFFRFLSDGPANLVKLPLFPDVTNRSDKSLECWESLQKREKPEEQRSPVETGSTHVHQEALG